MSGDSSKSVREQVLLKAAEIVTKDRNKQYGEPEDNFSDIARMWSVYTGVGLNATDVAMMMCLFKIVRVCQSGYMSSDSFVDICGYAACGAECAGHD